VPAIIHHPPSIIHRPPTILHHRVGFWLLLVLSLITLCSWPVAAQTLPLRGFLTAHDPSTMTPCNGRYYIFYTGQGILSKSSADKVFWSPGPAVFTNAPAWTTNAVPGFTGVFWAPDLLYFNSLYHLYYAVSTFGSQVSAIGLVTNPTLDPSDPSYRWTDQGPVITSTNGSPYNTIDPSFTWDNSGNLWMAFGSYWSGIYLVQLDPVSGLRISPSSPTYQLAYNSSIEASYLWRRGGYYYLFANWGSCCSGVNSTYNIRVGRSTSVTGPYLDRNGVSMVNNGGTLFLQASGKYTGPGHVAILSEGGAQSFTYHYYDANAWAPQYNAYGPPDFAFVPLSWTPDDWPVYANDWSAIYNFQADARDDNGQYYGLLQSGGAVIPDPTYGHVLNLNGTNQYVWLPPGAGYAQTFVAVVKWRGGAAWQRVFDFGFDTTKTVMMTAASDANVLRCDINPGGNLQTIQWTNPLPTNVWTHVALTLNGSQGVLYVNGTPVVTNTGMNLLPLNVAPQTNALGRSKFVADPYFNGQYACFRVYGRALSPAEIAAPIPTIAQPGGGSAYWPGTTLAFSGSAVDYANRPLAAASLSWQVNYSQDGQTNVAFGPVAGITNGAFNIPANATGGGNYIVVLTATDSSNRQSSVSSILSPANPPPAWSSYYPFKSDAKDANGHYHGTLNGGASFVSDPTRATVLNLSGTNQYVSLPAGLAGMQTFMAWVKWNGGGAWQRIYDFGDDTNRYSVLTPLASSGKLRFNISLNSIPGEQIVDAPGPFPSNVWTHVAGVMNGASVVLYTNGTPVATNLLANLVPQNLNATNLYFGKSQWPLDPFFSGRLSSVRIFSRPLAPSEIVAPQISIAQPAQGALYHPGDTIAFAGGANDFYDASIAPTGLTWQVTFVNAGLTNTIFGPQSGVTNGSFGILPSGAAATNGFYRISLSAVDSLGRAATNSVTVYPLAAAGSAAWASFYPFTNGAQDAANLYNGTLRNGASITNDPVRGNVLTLRGTANQYVSLPSGVGAAQTVSGWVYWSGGSPWQRVFDFGRNNNDFFFLTTSDAASLLQCAITPNLSVYNEVIESPAPMPINQWTHLAVVMDGRQGILYVNGNAVAVNNSVNLLPSDIGATNCNFGKSQFSADPYFNGRLSALRLNSAALSLAQLRAPVPVMTQPTNGSLFAGGQALNFAGAATDFYGAPLSPSAFTWSGELHSNGMTYAAFGPVAGVTNGSYLVPTNAATVTNVFYRVYLAVTDTNSNQQTVSQDVQPQISQLTFTSVPGGLQLTLDGQPFPTPSSLAAVVGMARSVGAPSPQNPGGTNYQFVVWSDGGPPFHDIMVPPASTTFTASFLQPSLEVAFATGNFQLAWPQWAAAMKLYSTSNLMPPAVWTLVTNAPALADGVFSLSLPATNGPSFYRLQFP
jgi:arabinan endo-1,5-alpha-L-arabinosidase